MKPAGKQLACIPFMEGYYEEMLGELQPDERERRFGQDDHVRRIGSEDSAVTVGKIVHFRPVDFSTEFDHDILRNANIPASLWSGLKGSTVNVFFRSDWKLNI